MVQPSISSVLIRRVVAPHPAASPVGDERPIIPPSVLRRPDRTHPFEPFLAEDVYAVALALENGFDPFWRDQHGLTCAMLCASRGLSEPLYLALLSAKRPRALALDKSELGLDAFDMAAGAGSAACMVVLAKVLGPGHRSCIGKGLMWHAVEAHPLRPELCDAWLSELCSAPISLTEDAVQALGRAREIGWARGSARLEAFIQSGEARLLSAC